MRSPIVTLIIVLAWPCLLAAAEPDGWYEVRAGDTLTLVAQRFGVTAEDIRNASHLDSDALQPGQRLQVPRPFRRTSIHDIDWRPPYHGHGREILRSFGPAHENGLDLLRTGADVSYPPGSRIYAPANGMVRYLGLQDGYGTLLILSHGSRFKTVLGPFSGEELRVAQGQLVVAGDVLGLSGKPAEGGRPYLHVELRRKTEALDPARLLH